MYYDYAGYLSNYGWGWEYLCTICLPQIGGRKRMATPRFKRQSLQSTVSFASRTPTAPNALAHRLGALVRLLLSAARPQLRLKTLSTNTGPFCGQTYTSLAFPQTPNVLPSRASIPDLASKINPHFRPQTHAPLATPHHQIKLKHAAIDGFPFSEGLSPDGPSRGYRDVLAEWGARAMEGLKKHAVWSAVRIWNVWRGELRWAGAPSGRVQLGAEGKYTYRRRSRAVGVLCLFLSAPIFRLDSIARDCTSLLVSRRNPGCWGRRNPDWQL